MRKRAVIGILFAALVFAAGGAWHWSRNIMEIENASGKRAQMITVTVCRRQYRLENLPSGRSKRVAFEIAGDSGFQVDVTFDDGSTMSETFGYVTGGAGAYNNRAKITIPPDRIEGIQE